MAVQTEVDICNIALGFLGHPGISALVDDPETATSKAQKWCSRFYPFVRDNLLEGHPWFWASTSVALVLDEDYPPAWGYDYAYLLPTNFVRLCEFETDGIAFSIEAHPTRGKRLLTSETEVNVRYVWAVRNVLVFPQFFVEAFARQLAVELLYPLTGGKDQIKVLYQAADKALSEAKVLDFGYELAQSAATTDSWISARQ